MIDAMRKMKYHEIKEARERAKQLRFTWSQNVGRDLICTIGRYTLSVYRNRHNYWLWSIYDGSKTLKQGRLTGYRRQRTAQKMAEDAIMKQEREGITK